MEDEFDIEELEIILGLKNKKEELNKIISDKKDLSFLGAISKILSNNNSNDLYEKNEPESNQNEMLANFSQKVGIDKIAKVKINNFENSNFVNSIKGVDSISHKPNIHYSKEYVQKLKKDFQVKVEEEMKPIEIKQNNYDYNRNYNVKDNKKLKKTGNYNDKKIKREQKKNEVKKENEILEEYKKEEDRKEDDKKEEKEENLEYEVKTEEKEENDEGNKQENYTGNSYRKNNRGYNNYNRRNQYNKNKGYKSKRENINAKRQFK